MWGSATGCLEYAGVLIQHVQGESDRVRQEKTMKRKIRTRQCMGSRDENIHREGGREQHAYPCQKMRVVLHVSFFALHH